MKDFKNHLRQAEPLDAWSESSIQQGRPRVLVSMTSSGITSNRILRLRQVKEMVGLSKTTVYARIAEGTFPTPISLGGRSVGWIESELAAWVKARIYESRCQSAT